MKRLFGIFTVLLTFVLVLSCGAKTGSSTSADQPAKKIAIVYSTGGKGDKSFNDSSFRGMEKAKAELGIEYSEYEPKDPSVEAKNQLTEYAQTGEYELIIGVGYTMKESLEAVANEYPNQKFALIDDVIEGKDNVVSLMFREQEGSFLTGALAAMMTKTNILGFVGAIEAPVIHRFATGFIQGVRHVNPELKILTAYVNGSNPFNDPVAGKQLAESLIAQNADIVMHAAGASGAGVFKAAQEKGVFSIGVDSNQDGEAPGTILTSMIKNVDVAVFETIKSVLEGKFESGVKYFGIAEDGVGISELEFTKDIIGQEIIDKLEALRMEIKEGKIKVEENGPLK
ncbi:BMP family lipoprotein [Streptobacillus moniliformis]|uniref:BMP family lipoprotein n=1 Tax=Streptobacillus moniliformis TaxID=34105 RepID=UPI0007E36D07|nr:BMP family ABC transporter substrate-binding protein [Streptobacillus moniliformis]